MQIYGIDSSNQVIHVHQGQRGETYRCPECSAHLRIRGGERRQLHFFHLKPSPCRLHGKSQTHLQIQIALQKMLAPHTIFLEHHFPQIGRIADLVWLERKLVFEVQVSPISAQEIRARNEDYQKIGYKIIWILHKKCFGRTRVTPAEWALRSTPHYYTNMNAQGEGLFFDQHSVIRFKRRIKCSGPLPVRFKNIVSTNMKQLPRHFPTERKRWGISFEGDLFHYPNLCNRFEERKTISWYRWITSPYRILFHYLLEKTTY